MDCPRCQQALVVHTLEPVKVGECSTCKGAWLDWDELRMLKDATDPDLRWMDFQIWKHQDRFQIKEIPLQCPSCGGGMVVIDYDTTTVRVDFCLQCQGVWLDAYEFQKIIEELSRELTAKTVSEYLRASLKEAKELITGPETFISEWRDFRAVIRMLHYRIFAENPKLVATIMGIQRGSPIR
jgi:Zn-finger nucleic acid-binding protein